MLRSAVGVAGITAGIMAPHGLVRGKESALLAVGLHARRVRREELGATRRRLPLINVILQVPPDGPPDGHSERPWSFNARVLSRCRERCRDGGRQFPELFWWPVERNRVVPLVDDLGAEYAGPYQLGRGASRSG